jgi:hypothetical protein
MQLVVEPTGSGSAEAFNLTASSGCPTFIVFRTTSQGSASFGSSCPPSGALRVNDVTITYGPASAGPTIRQAVAGLPR